MNQKKRVRVIVGFSLPGQGYYREGDVITLHFSRPQKIGVLKPEHYEYLLDRGRIEPIEEEASNGNALQS